MAECKKALKVIKNLRREVVNATLEIDISKEAHDIDVQTVSHRNAEFIAKLR